MLTRAELKTMLRSRGDEQRGLFEAARAARLTGIGDSCILRGVIEVTNVCRVNCDYCPMRRANTSRNDHYFLSADQIVDAARTIRDSGIDIILLQGGETTGILPQIEEAIPEIIRMFDGSVEVLLNLGCLTTERYRRLKKLGAVSYILKHETSDPHLHRSLRHEALDDRLACLGALKDTGFKIGTGLISGLPGQTLDSIVDDLLLVDRYDADMCSISPFIPARDTPMAQVAAGDLELSLNIVACLRILYPSLLIPSVSAFERAAGGGQTSGLNAGANVLTVNFSSSERQKDYLIYGRDRFVVTADHARKVARIAGLNVRGSVFLPRSGTSSPFPDQSGERARERASRPDLARRINVSAEANPQSNFSDFAPSAADLRTSFEEAGVRPNDVVALAGLRGPDILAGAVALWSIDAIPFPLPPDTHVPFADLIVSSDLTVMAGTGVPDRRGLDRTAVLQLTSGSTNVPKIARRSIESVYDETAGYIGGLGLDFSSCVRIPVPLAHSFGWGVAISAALAGCRLMLDLVSLPSRLARELDEGTISHLAVTPALAGLVATSKPSGDGRLATVLVGAGSASPILLDALRARFGAQPVLGYGSTETGGTFLGSDGIGKPIEAVEVRAPALGQRGELVIETRAPVLGYVGDPPGCDRVWRTGDLIDCEPDGTFRCLGRISGPLRLNSRFVETEPYKAALFRLPEVDDVAFLVLSEDHRNLEVLCAAVAGQGLRREAVAHALANASRQHGACSIFLFDRLPRNTLGKLDRNKLISSIRGGMA
ncbi:radical SAM protein [Roseibium sp. AS2]|uniref:AMP-binding protein n=1 Tax=Roseibium sp. AS2 TaxID=3135781 RepID=UPI0031701D1F